MVDMETQLSKRQISEERFQTDCYSYFEQLATRYTPSVYFLEVF